MGLSGQELALLQKTKVGFRTPVPGSSQLPSRDPVPSLDSIEIHRHTHTDKKEFTNAKMVN